VYKEGSGGGGDIGVSWKSAVHGGLRALGGYAAERIWHPGEQRDIFGRKLKRWAPPS
jgi:hypothetical protein